MRSTQRGPSVVRSERVSVAALQAMRLPVLHPQLGLLNYEATPVRDDPDGQIADTIALMRRYVLEDYRSREVAQALVEAHIYTGDPVEQVWSWLASRLRFVPDEETAAPWQNADVVEVLIRPRDMYTLEAARQGDCDDYVMMGAAMFLRLGIPVSFVTVAANSQAPDRFSHVYLAVYRNGHRIAIDASHGAFPGWEVPMSEVTRIKEWPVRETNWLALAGVIGVFYVGARAAGIS